MRSTPAFSTPAFSAPTPSSKQICAFNRHLKRKRNEAGCGSNLLEAYFEIRSDVRDWVTVGLSKQGLALHATDNRSFRQRVFPDNWPHWYWHSRKPRKDTGCGRKRTAIKTAISQKRFNVSKPERNYLRWFTVSACIYLTTWWYSGDPYKNSNSVPLTLC